MNRAMLQRRGRLSPIVSWIAAALALLALASAAPYSKALDQPEPAWEGLEPDRLPELAESGEFHTLLTWLKDQYAGSDDTSIVSLIEALQRYNVHRDVDADRQRVAYDEAMDQTREALEADRVEEALAAAIEAHGLAVDAEAMLEDALVRDLVARAEADARAAREANQWVDALSLYRLLELLHEDQRKYRDRVEEANQHVRVLRIYAPRKLRDLQEARAERRQAMAEQRNLDGNEGQDPDEPGLDADAVIELPAIDIEPWEEQIDHVGLGMLRRALEASADYHLGGQGYAPLLSGAVDALHLLVRTDMLDDTFPSLKDRQKREQFAEYLNQVSAQLGAANGDDLGRGNRANMIIDQIMAMNRRTLDLPDRVLIYEMAEGATGALDDFSSVIWPQQVPNLNRSIQGIFHGVGIQISRRDGQLLVVSPIPNTPAQRAGIKAGDIIAEVDGENTASWSLDKAVSRITGPEGTAVTLGIKRRGEPELIEYRVKRAEIEIESIRGWQYTRAGEWDYLIDPDSRIGYVRVTQFIRETANHLDAAIDRMQNDGPLNGLILDLRNNPGGLLASATDVADRFIEEGPLVFTVDADGRHIDERHAQAHRTYQPFPVVVLINQNSASGSEIVAGALQDHGRAVIVGMRSFGKGSVQDVDPLPGGAFLKLTKQHYKLPQGRIIDRQTQHDAWGISPDLTVEMTDRQMADAFEFRQDVDVLRDADDQGDHPRAHQILDEGLDPQLEAALLVLKTRLAARHIAMKEMPEHRRAAHRNE